ncbi:MAG: anti-sigma factor antagonist [Lachnospiraceae bacterium]|nr:anti-sigma factor antagonist [Lachnospiraceae bacterium]
MEEGKMLENGIAVLDRYLMIKMPAELDHHTAAAIREKADRYFLEQQVDYIVFDFEDTVFMDSSGIGVILGRYKKVDYFGGKVYAIHTGERVRKVMELSGLHNILEILS